MRWSFRTNGNYIDFVHTDETTLAAETIVKSLHNSSRCIDWSLPSDTTRITFTIDESKYENILVTDIDFDGTAMNSQDDFETGIIDMFPGLAGGGEGGSSPYLSATVTLTDAQIKALPTTGIQIIAAPGSGKALHIISAVIVSDVSGGDYSDIDGDALMFLAETSNPNVAIGYSNTIGFSQLQDLLANGLYGTQSIVTVGMRANIDAVSTFENKPMYLVLFNDGVGNLTGGNSANTLKVTAYYVVVDLAA